MNVIGTFGDLVRNSRSIEDTRMYLTPAVIVLGPVLVMREVKPSDS